MFPPLSSDLILASQYGTSNDKPNFEIHSLLKNAKLIGNSARTACNRIKKTNNIALTYPAPLPSRQG